MGADLGSKNAASERGTAMSELNDTLSQLTKERDILQIALQQREDELIRLHNSHSWRLTKPVRALHGFFCRLFPKLLENTKAYNDWESVKKNSNLPESNAISSELLNIVREYKLEETQFVDYAPLLKADPLTNPVVKLIAFYLPQFHPIPENDAWWGKGFTEWTNVKSAKPQFTGHYQPRIPGELGYYDLRDPSVQRRQVELAKLYGLGGFCFYFYWFAGKRLLETPTLQYLENKALDFPFCLCWANENWSRRWDGLERDILIGQKHSRKDDLAFIEYIAKYFQDKRYICIDGKPLLLVYRPSLLPSPKKTVELWRKWCREQGIGEIYLAYTQSFEAVDPEKYGFDAAIEFPPDYITPLMITDQIEPTDSDFSGVACDWNLLAARSHEYEIPDYKIFRGICPSWDNTARRKQNGTIFLNSSPHKYLEWLNNAIGDTISRFDRGDERLIFINAWNEWAEGTYLEPDEKHGYAHLEATRMVLLRQAIKGRDVELESDHPNKSKLAIIIHAFYPDVFRRILEYINDIRVPYKLFVSTTFDKEDEVLNYLASSNHEFSLQVFENRGRDILPFTKVLRQVISEGYDLFLKVHTKKSLHRKDGDVWRKDLFDSLLRPEHVESIIAYFFGHEEVGIIGPSAHIVPMPTYWGSNKEMIVSLSMRMGISVKTLIKQPFIAGSMFYGRTKSLQALLNIAINEDDYEPETGQLDATLAHAIERLFPISNIAMGMKLAGTENVFGKKKGIQPVNDFPFADKSKVKK